MCICERCDCKSECSYYEAYVEKNVKAVVEYSASVQLGGDRDPYLETISKAVDELTCEYFEEEQK